MISMKSHQRHPIAVTGVGCWYPGHEIHSNCGKMFLQDDLSFDKFQIVDYLIRITAIPPANPLIKRTLSDARVLDGFEFDWVGRRIPKSLFESTDLVHWLSLEVAEKALKDAGYTPDNMDREKTGSSLETR